ncbi:helix-turn-helix domain-containing protein [Parafilimonas sp.]|uniref:helix-turn-helix domain-containing protein n=1 Tax=Parafilimonas sp. TaxID=1969739 RepID=UPI0039E5AB2A
MKKIIHQGKNVKRFREMQGMQQAQLAYELGIGWTVNEILLLEQQEIIEDSLLKQIADILQVSVAVIKNFEEGKHIYIMRKASSDKLRFPVVVPPSDN